MQAAPAGKVEDERRLTFGWSSFFMMATSREMNVSGLSSPIQRGMCGGGWRPVVPPPRAAPRRSRTERSMICLRRRDFEYSLTACGV